MHTHLVEESGGLGIMSSLVGFLGLWCFILHFFMYAKESTKKSEMDLNLDMAHPNELKKSQQPSIEIEHGVGGKNLETDGNNNE